MKIKRFLSFAVALAMVLSIVPAMSLTASAAETVVYTATATGHSGSASGGSLFVACTGGAGDGSNTRAPFINGTTAGHNTTLGSTRIGVVEFQIDGSIDPNSVESAIMSLYLKSVNGNLGNSWTLIAGYETANPTLSYTTGGMNDADFAAVNNDYSNAATFWTNESCSNTTSGWKTMDIARAVKNALTANAALETPKDKVTVVIRLQVPTAGLNLGDSGAEVPYLTVTTNDPNLIAVTDNLNAISLPLATKANIELPTTVKGAADADNAVTWTSDNDEVLDGKGNYTSPEDITTVVLTPSSIVGSEVVYGKAHDVVVFPASRAGSVYDSGAGVFTIGTENIISANGTEASFEGEDRLAGWIAHTGQQTNTAVFWANSATNIVPDGEWAYVGQWNDPLTGSNYCTIDTMWPVNAGKYYLSFYAKKPAGGSTTYVYYSTDNAHHTAESQITSEAWVEKVSPTSDWVKYEYIIDAPQAGYIGFTSFNIGNNNSWGTQFDDFELYSAEQAAESLVGVPAVSAEVTVIAGNTPVLPATVNGTGSLGSAMEVTVTWDTTGLDFTTAGTVTVPGTVDGTDYTTSATVTVLNATFAIDDITTVNGQDAGKAEQKLFPVAISDEFAIEFTANYASFGDLWITIKTAGAGFFGTEQIPLGVNASGAFRPVNGNGSGGRTTADADQAYLTAGVDYRFFVTTDASTDKYTVSIYNEATGEKVVTVENFGYRTNATAIEAITSLTNNGAGSVTLTNIKVNANVSKTEYTFNITKDGETTTTTASFWTVDEAKASIADIEGYEKAVEVDGTTINVVYSNVYTAHATFIDADDNTVKVVDVEVKRGESYTVAAEDVFFLKSNYEGHLYYIPETVISEDNNNLTVLVQDDPNKYPAIEDALITGGTEIWGIKAENENSVFVASAGTASAPTVDANGEKNHNPSYTPSTLGTSRLGFFLFPVVDVEEGQKVTANFYVRSWHGNGFSNGNDKLRLAAHAVTDHSWATLSDGSKDYSGPDAALLESWNTPVFSEWCYNNPGYIAFDITEMMVAAKAAGLAEITLRLNAPYGAAYIAEREAAVAGGKYEDKVAYIQVEDANLVKVTETGAVALTKNGSAMNGFAYVAATDDVRLVSEGALVVNTDAGYYDANTTMSIAEATDFANTAPAKLGLGMAGGAQVRIGNTKLEDGAKLDALADSGLRFLATADYADTVLADTEVEFGIKVTAEASSNAAYVPAVNFQNDDNTVFSAAITNLKENNYNRKYTACAYAKVPMADGTVKEFTTGEVTRSIYQVSAGIMKNGAADTEDAYTVDDVVKNILNAYVNQTGIRLTVTTDGVTVEDGKYTGDVFFTVESVSDGDDGFNVTITPDTSWNTPAEIAEWWTDYVRFNNNNSVAKGYISANYYIDNEPVFIHADGSLTFNFDTTDDGTGGFDGPWIPIQPTDK